MLNTVMLIIEILLLIVSCIMLWQIWKFFKRTDISDEEPLQEKWKNYLKVRINILFVCVVTGTLIGILHSVLRFVDLF